MLAKIKAIEVERAGATPMVRIRLSGGGGICMSSKDYCLLFPGATLFPAGPRPMPGDAIDVDGLGTPSAAFQWNGRTIVFTDGRWRER